MTDPARPPLASLILGFGPALGLAATALLAWLLPPVLAVLAVDAGRLWGAAILLFLAGVRRGLSFASPGPGVAAQVATALALFGLGLAALVAPWRIAFALLMLGYALIALLDRHAAAHREAPRHFAALRPPQMAVFVAALAALLWRSFV